MATGWCVVDLETTGFNPNLNDRIVEIALVATDEHGTPVAEWQSLINPERDVGPTTIHRITAAMVTNAPRFDEVIGDVLEFMNGRRIAAHNARFDVGFLRAECERASADLDNLDVLCTMQCAARQGLARSLANCCAVLDIENTAPHTALGDATATAQLLAYLLKLEERESRTAHASRNRAGQLSPIRAFDAGAIPAPTGAGLARQEARKVQHSSSYLERIVQRLPSASVPSDVPQEAATAYAELLDRVVEDRVITNEEMEDLLAEALTWELSAPQIAKINLRYFLGLAAIAHSDGVISDYERMDLERVAALLGVDDETLGRALDDPAQAAPETSSDYQGEFDGMAVCFTGTSTCTIRGEPLSRAFAAQVATDAGLRVARNVTKKLDVLVVADPDTQSSKASRARQYGVRIVVERSFWPRIGVDID